MSTGVLSWFKTQSVENKSLILATVMYETTIVLRVMSTEVGAEKLLPAAMLLSELNHRISSQLVNRLNGKSTMNDFDLVQVIDAVFDDERLFGYATGVWGRIIQAVNS